MSFDKLRTNGFGVNGVKGLVVDVAPFFGRSGRIGCRRDLRAVSGECFRGVDAVAWLCAGDCAAHGVGEEFRNEVAVVREFGDFCL